MNEPFYKKSEIKFLGAIFLIVLAMLVASFILELKFDRGGEPRSVQLVSAPFPEPVLMAQAAYVYDIRTGTVLYAHNENARMPLASLTKIMAALVASELMPKYGTVEISREALLAQGDSGLLAGERWSLKDLLDFSLVSSSNDGMRAVALALGALSRSDATPVEITSDFVLEMNKKASELGLKNTYFLNETGLDETQELGGAYGSARDMAMLMEHIVLNYPEVLEATRSPSTAFTSENRLVHVANNTNTMVLDIPQIMGSKTGYTDVAGGNLIIVFDPEIGRPIVVSVLGSTGHGRFEDVRKLVSATMEHITGVIAQNPKSEARIPKQVSSTNE